MLTYHKPIQYDPKNFEDDNIIQELGEEVIRSSAAEYFRESLEKI